MSNNYKMRKYNFFILQIGIFRNLFLFVCIFIAIRILILILILIFNFPIINWTLFEHYFQFIVILFFPFFFSFFFFFFLFSFCFLGNRSWGFVDPKSLQELYLELMSSGKILELEVKFLKGLWVNKSPWSIP